MKLEREEVVPVFPLPGVVLFPRVDLGLYIFESRYRTMLSEVLDGRGRIAMAMALPRGEPDDESTWAVSQVVGVGDLVKYRTREDGTSDVLLRGEARARVEDWIDGKPFRRARVVRLTEAKPRSQGSRDRLKAELRGHLATLLLRRGLANEVEGLHSRFAREKDVGFLADFLAHHFLRDSAEKQALLEELAVEARVEKLRDLLAARGLI